MAFWEKINKELKRAVEDGWTAVKAAAEKTEEVTKTGKQRFKVHGLHKQAERYFADLGGMVYDMAKEPFDNPFDRSEVKRLIEEIREVERQASSIEDEIMGINEAVRASSADKAPPVKAEESEGKAEPVKEKASARPAAPKKAPASKESEVKQAVKAAKEEKAPKKAAAAVKPKEPGATAKKRSAFVPPSNNANHSGSPEPMWFSVAIHSSPSSFNQVEEIV